MILTLIISNDMLKIMKQHILESKPYEACGLIIGVIKDNTAEGREVLKIKNIQKSYVEFFMDPMELYNAYLYAEKKGLEVVAVYHSHPSSTKPSALDIKNMKMNPYVWLIFNMHTLEFEGFYLDYLIEKIFPVEIKII